MKSLLLPGLVAVVSLALVFALGVVLGVSAGMYGMLESLRASTVRTVEDGEPTVELHFVLGPFRYVKKIAAEAPADAPR
ncbi:hypothetical protein JCM14635_41010 [Megalodesulfovibrio paquesii]